MMNKTECLFSVVIPAYNAEKWIGQTLDSWARQTVHDFEVIVVDDGSEDNTIAIAQEFKDRLNLSVIRERHSGVPAHPCNIGIQVAQGKLIVHCDADDLAMSDRLEWTRIAWEQAGRCDCLIFADFAVIDAYGNKLKNSGLIEFTVLRHISTISLGESVAFLSADTAFDALLRGCFIRPCVVAFPKCLLEQVGGYDESLKNGQDYELYLRIAHKYPFVWVQRVLGLYRSAPGNISSRSMIQLAPSRINVLQRQLGMPLTREQKRWINGWISAYYQALGYEYGNQAQLLLSLQAYFKAFREQPALGHLRGIAASLAKAMLRHKL